MPLFLPFLLTTALLQPGSADRAILEAVDRNNRTAEALLERVVNINSGTENLAGVRAVGEVFQGELDALGFQTRWIPGDASKRAGHLVAKREGTGPRVLLIGHLDTVFPPDSPFQKFERIDNRYVRGPGIIDMKGGDVIIIYALKALQAAGVLKDMNISVVMTGDEEAPGRPLSVSRQVLIEAGRVSDAAIGFEDGPGDPRYAVTARRGTTSWNLLVTGKPAHSSQIFSSEVGAGAVFEAARILNAFREAMAGEEHLTFNPGVVLGGTSVDYDAALSRGTAFGKDNVVAEHALATGDLRTLSTGQLQRSRKTMETVVAASLPETHATLTFDEGYPPLAPTDGNAELLAIYDRVSREIGTGPVIAANPDKAGAADVSFVADEVKMILDGVGLMGHDDHTANETADLSTLPTQTKRAALMLYRIAHP